MMDDSTTISSKNIVITKSEREDVKLTNIAMRLDLTARNIDLIKDEIRLVSDEICPN